MPSSDHQYKGYFIRLKYARMNGGTYQIYKEVHGKVFKLKEERWTFITPAHATKRACNYIDNFEDQLKSKLKVLFIPYAERIASNPERFKSHKGLDIPYFIKAHQTIITKNITV